MAELIDLRDRWLHSSKGIHLRDVCGPTRSPVAFYAGVAVLMEVPGIGSVIAVAESPEAASALFQKVQGSPADPEKFRDVAVYDYSEEPVA